MRNRTRAVVLAASLPVALGACALLGKGNVGRRPGSDLVLPVPPQPRLMLDEGTLACAKVPVGPVVIVAGKSQRCTYAGLDSIRLPIPPVWLPWPWRGFR